MTIFYLIRHGETEHNANNNAYCGRTDVQLNDEGHRQSRALSEKLKNVKFTAFYVSPLTRAKQTMSYLTEDYSVEERLLEIDFGKWEGYTKEEISERFSKNWSEWQTTSKGDVKAGGNGETMLEAYSRIKSLIDEVSIKFPQSNVMIVAHNTIIRLLLTGLFEAKWSKYRSFKCANTSVAVLKTENDKFELLKINDDIHLVEKD
ncbi:histidine phosphatase family protein [Salinicoccus halodurans]|uniref:Alpha-ribazole phosphatase/probable phosphoglycerate mutase n=1 Tax=Salinicoccus halodurans TaxID=407035 RepID=A0AA94HBI4_9STAP|nr:histidine phosphatase family protein [Salinicoccus halodurans]SFK51395.1 alpha-ribazole phosphatase/probable phosphoglycerate mutase [Salinicoccus halodurans]